MAPLKRFTVLPVALLLLAGSCSCITWRSSRRASYSIVNNDDGGVLSTPWLRDPQRGTDMAFRWPWGSAFLRIERSGADDRELLEAMKRWLARLESQDDEELSSRSELRDPGGRLRLLYEAPTSVELSGALGLEVVLKRRPVSSNAEWDFEPHYVAYLRPEQSDEDLVVWYWGHRHRFNDMLAVVKDLVRRIRFSPKDEK